MHEKVNLMPEHVCYAISDQSMFFRCSFAQELYLLVICTSYDNEYISHPVLKACAAVFPPVFPSLKLTLHLSRVKSKQTKSAQTLFVSCNKKKKKKR